jgi:ATP-dependent DNA helicase 2 subunit 2
VKISKDNAIPEFRQRVASTEDSTTVWLDAMKQMGEITRQLLRDSTAGDSNYEQALENIRVMRYEMIECELPDPYNRFIHDLKKDLLNGSLGSDRRELWFKIRMARLGLIHSEETPLSEVSVVEATEVCDVKYYRDILLMLTWTSHSFYILRAWICRLEVNEVGSRA